MLTSRRKFRKYTEMKTFPWHNHCKHCITHSIDLFCQNNSGRQKSLLSPNIPINFIGLTSFTTRILTHPDALLIKHYPRSEMTSFDLYQSATEVYSKYTQIAQQIWSTQKISRIIFTQSNQNCLSNYLRITCHEFCLKTNNFLAIETVHNNGAIMYAGSNCMTCKD